MPAYKDKNKGTWYASFHYFDCPICKRLVCDHCFLICDDLDMCVQCAAKLNEKGTVVG